MLNIFKKESKGVTLIEASILLPIILYIIFFGIEFIKVSLTQVAVDSIAKECTFELMATGKTTNFDTIFQKYKPKFMPLGKFRYYCRLYSDITTMMATSPYGGETIGYPAGSESSTPTTNAKNNNFGITSSVPLLNKYQTSICNTTPEVGDSNRKTYLSGTVPSGYVFVLTVVAKYEFSSAFVAKLFSGGTNTNKTDHFILWARGSGMVN